MAWIERHRRLGLPFLLSLALHFALFKITSILNFSPDRDELQSEMTLDVEFASENENTSSANKNKPQTESATFKIEIFAKKEYTMNNLYDISPSLQEIINFQKEFYMTNPDIYNSETNGADSTTSNNAIPNNLYSYITKNNRNFDAKTEKPGSLFKDLDHYDKEIPAEWQIDFYKLNEYQKQKEHCSRLPTMKTIEDNKIVRIPLLTALKYMKEIKRCLASEENCFYDLNDDRMFHGDLDNRREERKKLVTREMKQLKRDIAKTLETIKQPEYSSCEEITGFEKIDAQTIYRDKVRVAQPIYARCEPTKTMTTDPYKACQEYVDEFE